MTVRDVANDGVPDAEPHDMPEGKAEPFAWLHDKVTVWGVPLTREPVIVTEPEFPRATVMPPRFDELPELYKRKSKAYNA